MLLVPRQLQRSGMTGQVPYYGGRLTPAQAARCGWTGPHASVGSVVHMSKRSFVITGAHVVPVVGAEFERRPCRTAVGGNFVTSGVDERGNCRTNGPGADQRDPPAGQIPRDAAPLDCAVGPSLC